MCLCVWCVRCGACCVCCVFLLTHIPNPRLIAVFAAAGVPSGDIPGPEPRYFSGGLRGPSSYSRFFAAAGVPPGDIPGPRPRDFSGGPWGPNLTQPKKGVNKRGMGLGGCEASIYMCGAIPIQCCKSVSGHKYVHVYKRKHTQTQVGGWGVALPTDHLLHYFSTSFFVAFGGFPFRSFL